MNRLSSTSFALTHKIALAIVGAIALLAVVPTVGTVLLGGSQVRCVGTNDAGELVKARGEMCDRLSDVVIVEQDQDGNIVVEGDAVVEP